MFCDKKLYCRLQLPHVLHVYLRGILCSITQMKSNIGHDRCTNLGLVMLSRI